MRTISAENYKLIKSSMLKIMSVICAAVCALAGYAVSTLSGAAINTQGLNDQAAQTVETLSNFSGFAAMFSFTQLSQIITILCAVFAGMYIVSEFDRGTVRNALSTGTSRTSWFLGKVYSQSVVTLWFTVETAVIFILTTAVFQGWGQPPMDNAAGNFAVFFLMALLQALGYSAIFLTIAFVIRGVGGTVGIGIAIIVLEQFLTLILQAFHSDILNRVSDNLLYSIYAQMNSWGGPVLTGKFAALAIPAAAVLAATLAIAYATFLKRDVK
ncbi:MAG: ABC transporter permease [Firmicutes bacterium]|nr:ABC transporter permease [Bacillota bacterium]